MIADERLELIRLKLKRADKHIRDLQAAMDAFGNSNPYKVSTKRNPKTRQLIYYLSSVEPTPDCFATITGDAINNLRSALDHLAQQLYLVGSNTTIYRDQTSFLIAQSAKKFKAGLPGKIEGMRQKAIDDICALEPYAGGKGADLWIFHRLNNIDKHRLIVTVGAVLRSVDLGALVSAQFNRAFGMKITPVSVFFRTANIKFPLKAGDKLLADSTDTEPNKNMQFRFEIVINEPGLIEGKSLLETIVEFSNRVKGIVEAFRPHLT